MVAARNRTLPRPGRGPLGSVGTVTRPRWGALEYFVSFMLYLMIFGVIAGLLRSRFPIDLGMFFVTNDGLIEWVLRKVGIRFVPDSLGATFAKAFVWVTGASILFAHWKDSAPAWLSSWLPPNVPWSLVARAALERPSLGRLAGRPALLFDHFVDGPGARLFGMPTSKLRAASAHFAT
jgi:hypothetical protein